jgi:hypothetical protein
MNKNKKPTLRQKVEMYERFLHQINLFMICSSDAGIKALLKNADNWSYAHRCGDGELSEKEIEKNINKHFWNLLEVPATTKDITRPYGKH